MCSSDLAGHEGTERLRFLPETACGGDQLLHIRASPALLGLAACTRTYALNVCIEPVRIRVVVLASTHLH